MPLPTKARGILEEFGALQLSGWTCSVACLNFFSALSGTSPRSATARKCQSKHPAWLGSTVGLFVNRAEDQGACASIRAER